MMQNLLALALWVNTARSNLVSGYISSAGQISEHSFSLNDRYNEKFVNDVFKSNILLTLKLMSGEQKPDSNIDWEKIDHPFDFKMVLKPNETFAFHDDILQGCQVAYRSADKS